MNRFRYAPLLLFEVVLMVLFFVFTTYAEYDDVIPKVRGFEETHAMIFIGFAYLMTFLKKYCYSATGYNLFLAAIVIQWSLLCQGFLHKKGEYIVITPKLVLEADIMSATVLITFGALLGLASGSQLLFIAVVESAVGSINLFLNDALYEISDIGGSIAIHAYGAYFGLGVSAALRMKKASTAHEPEPVASGVVDPNLLPQYFRAPVQTIKLDGPSYTSDVTAMLGTLVLWIYWPSFNSALSSSEVERQRAILNTYLSLASCTVVTFVLSAAVSHKPGKLDMVHIQNSTLAGGVAVGAVANMFITPGGAIVIGMGAAFISVLGYRYLTPQLEKIGIQDTCGVNNLHGMPGIYSGLISVVVAATATFDEYGWELENLYHATFPHNTSEPISPPHEKHIPPRSFATQAAFQGLALASTLGIALLTGVICGLIAKLCTPLPDKQRYDDEENWELP